MLWVARFSDIDENEKCDNLGAIHKVRMLKNSVFLPPFYTLYFRSPPPPTVSTYEMHNLLLFLGFCNIFTYIFGANEAKNIEIYGPHLPLKKKSSEWD